MADIKIVVDGHRCERCGHEWIARRPRNLPMQKDAPIKKMPKPRLCPSCKSAWWETPPLGAQPSEDTDD